MARVAVAALSARWLAQSACRAGWEPIALDVFGDLDTRRAASAWMPVGEGTALRIDGARLRGALRGLARTCAGWIAGPGCEPWVPSLAGDRVPPCWGNTPEAIAAVRDPRRFFPLLQRLGIDFPAVAWERPRDPEGWLAKDADGSGGHHIRPARRAPRPAPTTYFQRRVDGVPTSALFVADGRRAVLLACSEQLVEPRGDRPFVYCGVIGPVALPPALRARLPSMLDAIVAATGLRGLNGLDFLRCGDRLLALEINPRPSASMALYDADHPRGLLAVHVAACRQGELPAAPPCAAGARGERIVYARRACTVAAADVERLLAAGCRDVPLPGTPVAADAPLCSVAAQGPSVTAVRGALQRLEEAALDALRQTACA
ncbi:MAG: ATP-grasp domain-containing protein [Burkholderiaceae bacterium]|nr:ATP-grasp domain-containing protein [Burkholderiaceae bacterium]